MLHPWPLFPPEVNHESLMLGAGPAPSLAAAEAYAAHASAISATVASSSAMGSAASAAYIGVSGTESTAALASHNAQQMQLAGDALERSQIHHLAAAAHPATMSQMVPAPVAHANRFEEATDEGINPLVWGALTPRIADLNLEYFGFMWPNNASAGLRYGATLDALGSALMTPSMSAISGGSIAAAAVAAATVAESAAMSGMQAAVGMVSSGVSAVAGSAAALPASAMSSSGSSVASSPSTSAPLQPLSAVTYSAPPAQAQTLAAAQASTGMYAPSPNANLMTPPPVPPTQSPVQQMMPRPPVSPPMSAAPGLTSFAKPAEPFSPPPPPSGGKAVGLKPGMLNAAALRGPVSAMPLVTSGASTGTALATQPLAYVAPSQPLPPVPSSPPVPPVLNPGDNAQTLNPPPEATSPVSAPPQHTSPPAHPQATLQTQSGPNGGSGSNSGAQMMGTGTNGAPQAPQFPLPQDPDPPPPPPPQRGRAPDGVHPPVDGPLTPGPPSKSREQRKGAEHLWDDQGGEWRYHGEDSSHNPHWDYKPPAAPGKTTEWDQIPINGLPPLKGGDASSIISGLPPWLQTPGMPGTVGPPQNPLLTPYPGATIPPLPPPAAPPPDSGWFPDFHVPPIHLPDVTLPPLPNLGPTEIAEGGIGGILALISGCLLLG